jgi:hypothetical protein
MNPKDSQRHYESLLLYPHLNHLNSVDVFTICIFKSHLNIIPIHAPIHSQRSLSRSFQTKYYAYLLVLDTSIVVWSGKGSSGNKFNVSNSIVHITLHVSLLRPTFRGFTIDADLSITISYTVINFKVR